MRILVLLMLLMLGKKQDSADVIRVNLLGYKPSSKKIAVWASKEAHTITNFQLVDVLSGKIVFQGSAGKPFGAYGPFAQTYRLDFSAFTDGGKYILQAGDA